MVEEQLHEIQIIRILLGTKEMPGVQKVPVTKNFSVNKVIAEGERQIALLGEFQWRMILQIFQIYHYMLQYRHIVKVPEFAAEMKRTPGFEWTIQQGFHLIGGKIVKIQNMIPGISFWIFNFRRIFFFQISHILFHP